MMTWFVIAAMAHGVLLGAVSLYFAISTRRFLAQAVRTDTLIVSSLERRPTPYSSSDALRRTTFRPIVEFDDLNGQKQRVEISLGVTRPSWSEGDTISIRYAPDAPQNARFDTLIGLWFPCLACSFMSVWAIIGGVVIWWFAR
jgi:hypothetical protein